MVMTEEEKLLRKIQDLQSELDKKEIQINRQLDKLDGQEIEIMKYEQMFDENAPKSKIKKAKEEKLNIEINARDREIRELKDRMGFLRKEKIDLQKKYELEVKKNTETSVISVEELRAKDKAPLNVLLQELQDKINKQQSMIRRLKRGEIGVKSKDSGSDESNEMLKEKDKKIEILTDQIAELNNNLSKTVPKVELDDKPPSSNISKILLEELQNNLTKVKRRNNELKKKLEKYEKKITSKEGSEENSHVLELQNIISQLTSELEHKNKTIEENTISSIHRESESDADSLHSVVEELKSKLSKAKSQIANFQLAQEHSFKSLSPSETEGKLKIQREMASFLQKQLAEANNSLKTKEEEITTIKTEAIGIKRKYEQLNNLLKSKDQETNELYADIEALKMQIQTQNAPSQSIHPDVKLRLKELQSLVDDLSKQTIQQRLEISQLRKSKQ
jgi:chromosome segregation ATPase